MKIKEFDWLRKVMRHFQAIHLDEIQRSVTTLLQTSSKHQVLDLIRSINVWCKIMLRWKLCIIFVCLMSLTVFSLLIFPKIKFILKFFKIVSGLY